MSRAVENVAAKPISIILADDNGEFLDALSSVIQCEHDFQLLGTARDTAGAVRLSTVYAPDIALVDWSMPGGGGVTATAQITRGSPRTKIVALSASSERAVVLKMLSAGASGYVVKTVTAGDLVAALRRTAAGGSALSPEITSSVVEELALQLSADGRGAGRTRNGTAVRSSIEHSGIRMVFQPIVDVRRGSVTGIEALARFDHEPKRSPEVWFAEAASADLGAELDMAVAEKALAILPELPHTVDLFMNVRPETLFARPFAELMATASGRSVVLELTEHAPVEDYRRLKNALAPLRERGFRLAVDDVGAGYSSFRHLLNLRPDVLKIDISLCRAIEGDRARQVVAAALASLGRELGAAVVAEGIETRAELDVVRNLGVDCVQGFLLGRPAAPPLAGMLAAGGAGGSWA